jgi:hypothetical protein
VRKFGFFPFMGSWYILPAHLGDLGPLLGLLRAKAICCSVNRDRFLEKILLARFFLLAKFSHYEWPSLQGADHSQIIKK